MRLTLSFLAALVGRLGWFLAVTAAACMMLVIPVVILLSSIAHLEDDLLDDTNQVLALWKSQELPCDGSYFEAF